MIENGRKSDFRPAKKIATSSFVVPPYRDFVILVIFHGGITRKIRTELGLLRYEEGSNPGWAIKRNAAPLAELHKASRWSSKELSLSKGALTLKEHELLAAVVVRSARKRVLIVSSDSSPREDTNFLCLCSAASCR